MPHWKETVNINDALVSYDQNDALTEVAEQIRTKFRHSEIYGDDNLQLILGSIEESADMDDLDLFDECMNDLYDWANENLIWLNTLQ